MTEIDELFAHAFRIEAAPFDHLAIRDLAPLERYRMPEPERFDLAHLPSQLLGFPVIVDLDVAPGVLELRKGDETIGTVNLP